MCTDFVRGEIILVEYSILDRCAEISDFDSLNFLVPDGLLASVILSGSLVHLLAVDLEDDVGVHLADPFGVSGQSGFGNLDVEKSDDIFSVVL